MKIFDNTPSEKFFIFLKFFFKIYVLILLGMAAFSYLSTINLIIVGIVYIGFPLFEFFHFGKKVELKQSQDDDDE
jgi:hypothetical protein